MKGIVYVAGPYRSSTLRGRCANIANALAEARVWWSKGYAVLTPHANSAHLDGATTDDTFIDGDLLMMRRLKPEIVVRLPGWQDSEGSKRELALAETLGCQIVEARSELPWPLEDKP